ncbi:MAG: glycosyltransferase family 9 protein [Acidisphaera sp.]|nr:glycosyltransferase family 9 protein [Acidisphaera sp.]
MPPRPEPPRARILVIKHGALGDLVQSFDALQAIRRHHAAAELVLMTAPAHSGLARAMPWFDRIWLDERPKLLDVRRWWGIRRRFLAERFSRVYDLQCSARTAAYFRMLPPRRRPEWVGHAAGASHPNPDFSRGQYSNRAKMAAQLAVAGVPAPLPADLSWLDAPVDGFALPGRFVLLIPGCTPHLPHKRWPPAHYGALAIRLAAAGFAPVLLGTAADRDALDAIRQVAPEAIDLGGRTSLAELAALARRAVAVIGNDTGPTFLAAAAGARTLMLMSRHTDPTISAPWGRDAHWLKRDDLTELPVADVAAFVLSPPVQVS